jgi:hypothetical protein
MHIQLGMTAPEFNGRPLDGIFVKETFKLKRARQSMNAECIISLFLLLSLSLSLSLAVVDLYVLIRRAGCRAGRERVRDARSGARIL